MRLGLVAVLVLACAWMPAHAEIEKTASLNCKGLCLHWWPKLSTVDGWHQDKAQSERANINAQVPDGSTFDNAETVIYAKAVYKPTDPADRSLTQLIQSDQVEFHKSGVSIAEIPGMQTADGQQLQTFTYSPTGQGSWEQVSYGEEGDYYLIFVVSSHTRQGLDHSIDVFRKFVRAYREKP